MKLYLNRYQAAELASRLENYVDMLNSCDGNVFESFEITFPETCSKKVLEDANMILKPIAEEIDI